jgi:putative FmdB family regulatory protein
VISYVMQEDIVPIYEYSCVKCKNRFEMLRSLKSAGESVACPICGDRAQRVLSACATFSRGDNGVSKSIAGSGNSCGGCSSGSCSSCH